MDAVMTTVEWKHTPGEVDYPSAVRAMEDRVAAIHAGDALDLVWLVEHPPLYTGGTSAKREDLLTANRFPVFETGRGGQYTYHGPGQRVAYVMMDLRRRDGDVRRYVRDLEQWLIDTVADFGITAERREGRVGVWVDRGEGREDKIGALGVRVRRSVTYHGVALNVAPDLDHFSGIVPCGVREHGVTSLEDLGVETDMDAVDAALRKNFERIFRVKTAG
ncbi:MAG TPA: lipoyl(octanoyl) transferase LipB [Alphaproteobacteria bacterium]|nr:lipoyl(octanoyl) transferase LipB [Alphaproteobacteria bacterium]